MQILGKDNELIKLIYSNNFSEEDLEYLVTLSNEILDGKSKLSQLININLKEGFAKGYVITSEKDTIYGSIRIKKKFVLGETLIFINSKGEEFKFKPKELDEYHINNRVYLNRVIDNKKVILKVIVIGKISLYRDSENSKSYLKKEGSSSFLIADKKYKFLKIFKDKKKVYSRIIDNDYKKYEIKSMVRLYNKEV